MYYKVKYKECDDSFYYEVPLWTETINFLGWDPKDPERFCQNREDAIKIFNGLKRDMFFHSLKLIECRDYTNFDWAIETDITQEAIKERQGAKCRLTRSCP